jgi:hypothetical protein
VKHAMAALASLSCLVGACVVETEPLPLQPLHAAPVVSAAPSGRPLVVADAAPAPDAAAPQGMTAPPPPDSFRTCGADTDCVAVLRNGCCHDGLHEALNKASAAAYTSSFSCGTTHPICPMHLVLDRRVPACDTGVHLCKLVDAPSP